MKVLRRRRREHKTDYATRLKLLKSGKARVVFRRTNKYVVGQYVTSSAAQDEIKIEASSKELLNFGWDKEMQGSLKSVPATYLTGFLMGKKIIKNKLEKPILDLGMIRTLHKSKVYAFLKGLIDAGIEISCKEEAFPEEGRLNGEQLKKKIDVKKIKSEIEKI